MIKPTVGRVVLFTPTNMSSAHYRHDTSSPLPAIVVYVWGDRMVNLATFDQNGNAAGGVTSVPLLQDGDAPNPNGYYCEWMPYQKAVASGQQAPTLHASGSGQGQGGLAAQTGNVGPS